MRESLFEFNLATIDYDDSGWQCSDAPIRVLYLTFVPRTCFRTRSIVSEYFDRSKYSLINHSFLPDFLIIMIKFELAIMAVVSPKRKRPQGSPTKVIYARKDSYLYGQLKLHELYSTCILILRITRARSCGIIVHSTDIIARDFSGFRNANTYT